MNSSAVDRSGPPSALRVVLVCLGGFGIALAVTAMMISLPNPAAGGTCGPGRGAEAAAVAFFDPVTIGAGPEPAASHAAERNQWHAFVDECQSAADDRIAVALPLLVVSLGLVLLGLLMGRRARRRRRALSAAVPGTPAPAPAGASPWGYPPPAAAWADEPGPSWPAPARWDEQPPG